jgi:hypothetical protein
MLRKQKNFIIITRLVHIAKFAMELKPEKDRKDLRKNVLNIKEANAQVADITSA